MLKSDFVVAVVSNEMIIILIQVMKDLESLTVLSVENYCKVIYDICAALYIDNTIKPLLKPIQYFIFTFQTILLVNILHLKPGKH